MTIEEELRIIVKETARRIKNAEAVAIFAGAGMGVDSGLESYRGKNGLWKKSITLNNQKINYYDLMKPSAFKKQPELAWGMIGMLMQKYQNASPHPGFEILRELTSQKEYFIVTSNIDGQFQKAGFDSARIFEFHGSLFNTQCGEEIECGIWETPSIKMNKDGITARSPVPVCPVCNAFCRPNVHLFDDNFFAPALSADQQFRYMEWRQDIFYNSPNIVALEIGAGKTIPTIRRYAERFAENKIPLIRINPFDYKITNSQYLSIPLGANEALRRIAREII